MTLQSGYSKVQLLWDFERDQEMTPKHKVSTATVTSSRANPIMI